ncbi:MAG: lysylphosphatidylglycerol synthase transmembrane domain-containing protein [Chloroflexota bacterium]|nr:lysylphosphatidylglycerol synthase transmembrane domain-containing protein [Chloroflexota bacterium]
MSPRWRSLLARVLPWLVVPIILYWLARTVSLQEAWQILAGLDARLLLALILLNVLILVTLSGRWWLILRALGHRIPYLSLTGYRLGAFGISYFTPGPQFGGEPLQVALPEKHNQVPRTTAVASVTLDKSLELLVNFAFLAISVAVILRFGVISASTGLLAGLVALALLALPVLYLLAIWRGRTPLTGALRLLDHLPFPDNWRPRYRQARDGMQASETQVVTFCREQTGVLFLALGVSLFSWIAMVAEFWLALRLLGVTLSVPHVMVALAAARLALLAAVPGALGTLEASQVLVLGALGVNPAVGLSLGILIRLRDVFVAGTGLWWGTRKVRESGLKSDPAPASTHLGEIT